MLVDVGWKTEPRLALIRSGHVRAGARAADPPRSSTSTVALEDWSQQAQMLEQAHEESEGPSIEDADVIVAGGRGLGKPENFALVEDLAKALGGAVAATRAVVDAGWYPYASQVGQTGKTVAPKLYIACGISGAIQHKVGHAELRHDRRDQQGPERADLRVLRPRRRRRPARDRPQLTELVKRSAERERAAEEEGGSWGKLVSPMLEIVPKLTELVKRKKR